MEELEVVARQLRRHAVRRKEGVPTVSLLVGEPATLAITLERSLAPTAVVHSAARQPSPAALARLWLSAVLARHDLIPKALSAIEPASRPEQVLAAWCARSAPERARWLEQVVTNSRDTAVVSSARWLSDARVEDSAQDRADPVASLQLLAAWLPRADRPALCLFAEQPAELGALVALALAAPALSLLAVISQDTLSRLPAALDRRTCALLLEGLVSAGTAERRAPAVRGSATPAPVVEGAAQLASLREHAASALDEARRARAAGDVAATAAEERARSLAELLLYQLLQREPTTRGLFELNGLLPFDFGPRRAEIDLLCVALKLAVEVDGYHHFTEASAYRRDRRKDVLLQTHGFWISRYLASDVVDQGEQVVRSVAEVVLQRNGDEAARGGIK